MKKIKKKRALFVISYLDKGGAEKILSNITTHFPKEWDIDILVNDDKVIDYPFRGNILSLGIKEKPKTGSILFQSRVLLKRIRCLCYLKKKGCYQVCISFMDSANVAAILSGNKYCKNIINIVNNMSASGNNEAVYRFLVCPLIKMLYNKADKIVAVSEDVKSNMIQSFKIRPDKITAIYCSIDMEDIISKAEQKLSAEEEEWFSKEKTVITAGRLEKQKGQWHLIRAFREVLNRVPDAKLVIFGEGSLEKYLKELVREYQMEASVLFFGFSSNLDMYMAKSAIFAFPSLYEGMSVALLEALACGIPCVAADGTSGAREQLAPKYRGKISGYIKGEYGIITEESVEEMYGAFVPLDQSEKGMVDAIVELLLSDGLRIQYAEKARERSRAYDIRTICEQWMNVIDQVM